MTPAPSGSVPQIGLVEDDPLFRDFVRLLLDTSGRFRTSLICASAEEALARLPDASLNALILDLGLPGRSGLSILPEILRLCPGLPVLVLSAEQGDARVLEALRLGACGYVLKTGAGAELLAALEGALAGGASLSPAIAQKLLVHLRSVPPVAPPPAFATLRPAPPTAARLTARELEIVALVAEGLPDKQIADRLGISPSTVKNHLTNIYGKWRVQSRTEAAVRFERRQGNES